MNANSKKLYGNGRWEASRIMLPEHPEQYLQLMERDRIKATGLKPERPPASRDELQLMHDYVLLPMARTIAEKNRHLLEEKGRTLKPLFVKATNICLANMQLDIEQIAITLKRLNITVYPSESVDGVAFYAYTCRGHEGAFAITREYVRTSIGTMIARYIDGVFSVNEA
ncbi:hypothetical protein M3194_15835 [Paenibacillus glycanilyticus]|uniref:hypothetical protein n=1 Tax=Paenibacillus glycanilyticus TaxID=126569 RepID=UPI0020413714|nr:hypothetical protein [Paenibacillus glycanilyticus]MCM3628815.1 hypothetical protein [Paenibacillus glycanilyticus]